MMKEHRLIGFATSTVRYNSRNAAANAALQDEAHKAAVTENQRIGDVGTYSSSNMRATQLSQNSSAASQQMNTANTVYGANGAGTTLDTATGKVTQTLAPSTGAIQDSERERLRTSGMTDSQIAEQEKKLQPQIQSTMTNTGQGSSFDPKTGIVEPGSGRLGLNNPAAKVNADAKAAAEDAISRIKGYTKQTSTKTDEAGNTTTTESMVEDPGATAEAQQKARDAQAAKDAAAAIYAAQQNEQNAKNQMVPTIDSFLSTLPKDIQETAKAVFQPVFDAYGKQAQIADQNLQMGMDSQEAIDAATAEYLQKQRSSADMMFSYFKQLNGDALERKLDSAEQTYKADQAAAELARSRTQQLYERALRDQMIKNEEDRKSQLLGLGVSGGWRASRQTADVIKQLQKGDNTLSDMYADAAFAEQSSAVNLQKVSANYHANISAAYDAYDAANGVLFNTMMDRAAQMDKTIYDSSVQKTAAIKGMISDYLNTFGSIAGDMAKSVTEQNKFALDTYSQQQKEAADKNNKTFNEAMKYIDTYGTQNKNTVMMYEQSLGLPPGSLSNQKTIEELKMRKENGEGMTTGVQIGQDITNYRANFKKQYPYLSGEDIDQLVYNQIYGQYGDDSKGRKVMRDVFSYMMQSPINGETYTLNTLPPTSSASQDQVKTILVKASDAEYAATNGAGELYTYLTKELPEKQRYSDAEAIDYITKFGYVHVPSLFLPRSMEFDKKK